MTNIFVINALDATRIVATSANTYAVVMTDTDRVAGSYATEAAATSSALAIEAALRLPR